MVNTELKLPLERIDVLPAMPIIVQKLLTLPLDTKEGEVQLLKLIEQDPQISAKIIGLSNSALFGIPRKIASVGDAAMCLGLTRVKSVAIGIATMSTLKKPVEGKLKASDLWLHSMAIAIAMRSIAKYIPSHIRPMDEQIFLAGLLHDIGFNALSFLDVTLCDKLLDQLSTPNDTPILELEQELMGTHHSEIGARLATHWGLPDEIVEVIRYHHTPNAAQAGVEHPLIHLVHITEKIIPDVGISEHTQQEITQQEWRAIGVNSNMQDTIIEEAIAAVEQARAIKI
ncbi:HD-like signal output (HDOD) domain, no enzymatic activity [Nitrosomonas sp. PY1]|uniref:HDOD domain-containing protein n=1 Tax=Nitrosomonas sp. PY1 TaxID=1803906 RepID=UPI001FC84D21|nr:HDOD domain-containing protein [Nitrosomonas sp. PY1]GKS68140.1 HD-like signal output (HDOD) domain, no enzymatic activity [Nitrosomonas sp. PY1]